MKNLTALVAAATLSVCTLSVARADTGIEPRTATVHFADLDPVNAQGAAVLYRRLKVAAEKVCRDLDPGRQLTRMQPYKNCMQLAIATAVEKIDRPILTAYSASRGVLPAETALKIASNK
ncbi:MAG TPA: UrcA family protein [Steroidobacteraceae bacterium]|nr:UrcA family protein [Steroidobacteraceae bacterium]